MFGKKKDKKPKKVEKMFADSENEKLDEAASESENQKQNELSEEEIMMGITDESQLEEDVYTEQQQKKLEKLSSVKDKISKILKSSNVEIVDENFGDEYESGDGVVDEAQMQQDYDSLKALYGAKGQNKGKELTLTIDDFDYSHTGQYIEEYDLMHLKGIKKIRLQNKHSKLIKRLAIIGSAVAVVAVLIVVALQMLKTQPVVLTSISLNEQTGVYYVNETFDYSGLYIITKYSDGTTKKVKLNTSNFSGTVGGNNNIENGNIKFLGGSPVTITFSYGGYTTEFVAEVKTKVMNGLRATYDDSLFDFENGKVVTEDFLRVYKLFEGDCPSERMAFSSDLKLIVNGITFNYNSTKHGFELSGLTSEITSISIKYDTFTLNLSETTGTVSVNI